MEIGLLEKGLVNVYPILSPVIQKLDRREEVSESLIKTRYYPEEPENRKEKGTNRKLAMRIFPELN
jgi:hypothetical protein